jgi:hypothetical protein
VATYLASEGFSWRYVELHGGLNNAAWRRWCSRVLKARRRVLWLRSAAWVLYVVTCFLCKWGLCRVYVLPADRLFAICGGFSAAGGRPSSQPAASVFADSSLPSSIRFLLMAVRGLCLGVKARPMRVGRSSTRRETRRRAERPPLRKTAKLPV